MPPPAVTITPRKLIDPSKPGKYNVKVGDSFKDTNNSRKGIASLKYNHKPTSALTNGRKSCLKSKVGGSGNEVSLEITPSEAVDPPVAFAGVQTPSKKTECVLIYDPTSGTFTLEELTSIFTLNLQSPGGNIHPPLSLPKYNPDASDDEQYTSDAASDGDATKADKENPFDFRHFLNNKFDVPVSSTRTREDKNRKERLEKIQGELSDLADSEEEEEKEDIGGLIVEEIPTPQPRKATVHNPPRQRAAPPVKASRQRQPKATPAKKPDTSGPISLSAAASSKITPSFDFHSPSPHTTTLPLSGTKRPHDDPAHCSSDESDADDESEEEEDDEFPSGELIVEGEDDDNDRNNRSRSTTAGLGAAWSRRGPISLTSRGNHDVDMDEPSDDENDAPTSPYQGPTSLAGLGGGRGRMDEESSDEDEDEDEEQPRHHQNYYHQQQSAPTPQQQVDDDDDEEEEEDLERYLVQALLENQDDAPAPSGVPMSLGRMHDNEESSSEEE